MTSLTVTVRHVWPGPLGGAIFTGQDQSGQKHRIVVPKRAILRVPQIGESWIVEGNIQEHPRYGIQFHAEAAVPIQPKGELITRFLAQNKAFQGVGEVRAKKLWAAFGEGLYVLLDAAEAGPLAEALGSEELAAKLVEAWGECKAEGQVVRWLEQHEFPMRLANKVMRLWGVEAPEKIQANPYRMLAVAGWSAVDKAALGMGIAPDADIRRIAAVEAECYRSMGHKHTVALEDELLRGVAKLLGQPKASAEEALRLAEEDHAVVKVGEGRWQALGPHVMESYVRERIEVMVAAEHVPSGHLLWRVPTDGEVAELAQAFESTHSLQLTDEQKQAVWMALTQRFSVISGGAGTGKTTMLQAVHFAVSRREGSVRAIALAGRAAIRMQEATGSPARTIAGFLGAVERGDVYLGGGDLIVVDEASMVDLPLAYALFRAIPEDCRVLMVGDPYQLPPIGMGVVFSAYCEDDRCSKVELTRVHRQTAETGIPVIAGQIRLGEMPNLRSQTVTSNLGCQSGISFLDCTEKEAIGHIIELLGELGGPAETQILGAVKRGPSGIQAINAALYQLCSVGKPSWGNYSPDNPVIYLDNDYERRIFNGTLGVVVSVDASSMSIAWDGHDKPMTMSQADLESLDLAYAISIHKAQGSQFRRVIVPIFPSRLLDRTLIYTALTRATEQVILLGDRAACKAAIKAEPASHRRLTGIRSKE